MADSRNIDNPGRPGGRASSEARDEIDNPGSAGVRSTPDQGVRSSIDVEFVGSLYGELTPAEQTRLSAHLESHPTDQQTLDGLRSTRQMVRESRIADHQVDPPQAISALLLQEAARRAPKRDAEQSWFSRIMSALVAHPALASVASLVVVIGVGSTLYMRNGAMPLAERAAGQSRAAASEARRELPTAPAPEAVAAAEAQAKPAADTEAMRVGLDEAGAELDQKERAVGVIANDPAKGKPAERKPTPKLAKDAASEFARAKSDDAGKALPRDDARAAKKAAKDVSSKSFDSQVEVSDKAEALGTSSGAQKGYAQPATVAGANDTERDEAPLGRFAAPPPSAPPTARASATQSAPTKPSVAQAPIAQASPAKAAPSQTPPRKTAAGQAAAGQASPGKAAGQAPVGQAPPAQALPVAPAIADEAYGGGASGAKNQTQSSTWARDVHRRVVGLVKAGKCEDATPLLAQLKNRDPDYYEATVVTDRALGLCLARIAEAAQQNAVPRKKQAAKTGLAQ